MADSDAWIRDPDSGRRYDAGYHWKRRDYKAARQALEVMSRDPDRTDAVGEFLAAMSGPALKKLFRQVMSDPDARRIMVERRDLLTTLSDREHLSKLPADTLGRVYYDWTQQRDFTAEGLATAVHVVRRDFQCEVDVMSARITDMHDLWHVLNGWGGDMLGEMHLLGYSYAQLRSPGWLVLGSLFNLVLVSTGRFDGVAYFTRAFIRGKRAKSLIGVDWESMLELPIDDVRRQLRIPPPRPYRPLSNEQWQVVAERSFITRRHRAQPD